MASYINSGLLPEKKRPRPPVASIWILLGFLIGSIFWWAFSPNENEIIEEITAAPGTETANAVPEPADSLENLPKPENADTASNALPSFEDLSGHIVEADIDPNLEEIGVVSSPDPVSVAKPKTISGEIKRGETLSTSFDRMGLDYALVLDIQEAFKDVFSLRKCQPGNKWEAKLDVRGEMEAFTYNYKPLESYYVRREGDTLQGYKIQGETTMYVVPVAGRIENSLSTSVWRHGESNLLAHMIASIFAWDIDFYSDVRKGDSWQVLVEKHYYNGKFVKYGNILAASYKGSYVGNLYAYYFETPDKKRAEYFDVNGNALQKSFLRAPLDTTRVTSKFGYRMHPTVHKYKKHNGVDYGAPRGTPVWAIASGKVLAAGWMGLCGKGVKIKHNNGYESIYCHMSSVALRSGSHVKQKDLVGRVGSTGRSTGPHLHFGLKKNGQWMNPLKVKYEPGKPLEKKYKDRWKEARDMLKGKLEAITIPEFFGPDLPPDYVYPETESEKATPKVAKKKKKSQIKAKSKEFRPRPEGIKRALDAG